jgi:PAS domain S-box-containing protein
MTAGPPNSKNTGIHRAVPFIRVRVFFCGSLHNRGDTKMTGEEPGQETLLTGFERAMALAGAATLKEALPICLEALLDASEGHLDCGWVYLLNENSETITMRYSFGVAQSFADANRSWAPESLHGRSLLRNTHWYGQSHEIFGERDGLLTSEGLRALAVLPVFRKNAVEGCFCLASHASELAPRNIRCDLEALSRWFDKTISRLQVSESRIKESWDLLALFDAMEEMVFAFGLDGEILWMNRTARDELGFGKDDVARVHLLDLHPPEWHPDAARTFRRMLSREQQTSSLPLMRKGGGSVQATTLGVPGRWRGEEVLFGISRLNGSASVSVGDMGGELAAIRKEIGMIAARLDERLSRIEEAVLAREEGTEDLTLTARRAGINP